MMAPSMRLRLPSLIGAATVAIALFSAPGAARADSAIADQLFQEAKAAMKEGKLDEACPKFQASYDADPGLGALLNLADCLERAGRLASAYGKWAEAVEVAHRKGDERVAFARERRDAIKPKLSSITVQVSGTGTGLVVYKGNTKLSEGAYGTALPTDPGQTVVQVVRGDAVLWERTVVLKEAEATTVVVDLGEIEKANPAPVKKRVEQKEGVGGAEVPVTFWGDQRIAGLIVSLVGVAGAGVGFTMGGLALGNTSNIDENCTPADGGQRYCTQDGIDAASTTSTFADASTYTLIGSGIVFAVGLTVFITAPGEAAELDDRAYLIPWFDQRGGGVMVGGRF